jgi:ATP-binding cassette subfamily B (MDR/TAP) protein 1
MIALAISPLEPDNLRYTTHYWVYFLMGLGVLAFGSRMVQSTFLGMTAERVARSQRALAFAHVFELPLSFFSKPENSPIMLVTRIAIGPANASEMLVGYFAEGMFHMITLTAGAILSVSRGWSLALSLYALYPIASGASDLQQNALLRLSKRMKRAYRRTIRIVTETVPAIRTVLSLNRTQTFLDYLVQDGGQSLRIGIITAIISSLGFGISQALLYLIYTIGFFYGTNLVEAGEYTLRDMLIIVFAVMFTLTSGSAVIVLNAKYDRQNKSAHEYL